MSKTRSLLTSAVIALLLQGPALAQTPAAAGAPPPGRVTLPPAKQQLSVRAIIYIVPNRSRRRLARTHPELVGEPRKGAAPAVGGTGVDPAATDRFAELVKDAERRGLIRVVSRSGGMIGEGETLELGAGGEIPVVASAARRIAAARWKGRPLTGAIASVSIGRWIRLKPLVVERTAGEPRLLTTSINFEMATIRERVNPETRLPELNMISISTVAGSRDGETIVLGGMGNENPRGQLYLACRVEVVDGTLAAAARDR